MQRNNHKHYFIFIFFALLALVSCQKREVYYQFAEIKHYGWKQYDTLRFEIDSSLINLNATYKISIELSHNAKYPYRNIWLYFQDDIKDSIPATYKAQYILADEFGKWYGSGFGALYQLSFTYKDSIRFTEKRNHTIKIIHGMRNKNLQNIEKIGVKMEVKE